MTNDIKEKQKISFEYRVITPRIIKEIAKLVSEEAKSDEKVKVIFSIDAKNKSFESESPIIFEKLENQFINRIYMGFDSFNDSKKIEIQITHQINNKGNLDNYVWVSGNNSNWVGGVMKKIEDILSSAKPQPKVDNLIRISIFSGLLLINICFFDLMFARIEALHNFFISLFFMFGIPVFSLWFYDKSSKFIISLWPCIELQTGQPYQQDPRNKRILVWGIISLIILPLIIGLILEAMKYLA